MPNRLGNTQIDRFIEDGFVKIEGAFPKEIAAQARSILWKDTGRDPDDPATWIKPVIRLSDYPQEPFRIAANTKSQRQEVRFGAVSVIAMPSLWMVCTAAPAKKSSALTAQTPGPCESGSLKLAVLWPPRKRQPARQTESLLSRPQPGKGSRRGKLSPSATI
jgi:hypothetical protein